MNDEDGHKKNTHFYYLLKMWYRWGQVALTVVWRYSFFMLVWLLFLFTNIFSVSA